MVSQTAPIYKAASPTNVRPIKYSHTLSLLQRVRMDQEQQINSVIGKCKLLFTVLRLSLLVMYLAVDDAQTIQVK